MTASPHTLRRNFWPRGDDPKGLQVFALIDGARNPRIAPWIRLKTLNYECLYSGTLTPG